MNSPRFSLRLSLSELVRLVAPARLCLLVLALGALAGTAAAQPVLSNVRAVPRAGTKQVEVTYNLAHPAGRPSQVRLEASPDGGATYRAVVGVTGAVGAGVTPGNNKLVVWNAGEDWLSTQFAAARVRVVADDSQAASTSMLPIPAGTFTMGDVKGDPFGNDERPTRPVTVSAFFLQQTEVTFPQWREIVDFNASGNLGYDFAGGQRGAGPSLSQLPDTPENNTHPVTFVSWFDIAKWCNARSRKEGLAPCYFTDAAFTNEFKTGTPAAVFCNFAANGYRLPTEAEWEYAARGGPTNLRYPWGDTIDGSHANYGGGDHVRPPFVATSPVGYYNGRQVPAGVDMRNGYGLYDMIGNVREWVWDWYGPYPATAQTDPRGPDTGTFRGTRGGDWLQNQFAARITDREAFTPPTTRGAATGFRPARTSMTAGSATATESASFALDLRNAGGVPTSRLANLSVRTALAASQNLIVGIVVSGGPRPMLVRAVGPALANFGVSTAMSDPQIELFEGNTRVLTNDNWTANLAPTFASVGAFPLAVGSRDAAFVPTVNGARSIVARGTGAGVVLVEAYDTGTGNSPRLVNVSARNRVGTGDDILIAGFNLTGTGPKQVLVRAAGPALQGLGVSGFLADPSLELTSAAGVRLAANDNWSASLAPVFANAGAFAFASNSRDAALVALLPPGTYTVQVRGVGDTTGEAVVELYEIADTETVR